MLLTKVYSELSFRGTRLGENGEVSMSIDSLFVVYIKKKLMWLEKKWCMNINEHADISGKTFV